MKGLYDITKTYIKYYSQNYVLNGWPVTDGCASAVNHTLTEQDSLLKN